MLSLMLTFEAILRRHDEHAIGRIEPHFFFNANHFAPKMIGKSSAGGCPKRNMSTTLAIDIANLLAVSPRFGDSKSASSLGRIKSNPAEELLGKD